MTIKTDVATRRESAPKANIARGLVCLFWLAGALLIVMGGRQFARPVDDNSVAKSDAMVEVVDTGCDHIAGGIAD